METYTAFEKHLKEVRLYDTICSLCTQRGHTLREVFSRVRSKSLTEARRSIFQYLRGIGWSYPQIGNLFRRDHTTIMASVKRDGAEPLRLRVA